MINSEQVREGKVKRYHENMWVKENLKNITDKQL